MAARAGHQCEYCQLSEAVSFFVFHVDHVLSVKHGGRSVLANLAYCCPDCNHFKGSDLGTFLKGNEQLTRFFNPRKELWGEHFALENGRIRPRTPIGRATERILKLNLPDRLVFRRQLAALGNTRDFPNYFCPQ